MKHASKIDMRFVYRDAAHTNIRATFQRRRQELKELAEKEAAALAEQQTKVTRIKGAK